MRGQCNVVDDCVASWNYPNHYNNGDSCHIRLLQEVTVIVGPTFEIESCPISKICDVLTIAGKRVTDAVQVPSTMNAGDDIIWTTDYSATGNGWKLCFIDASPTSTTPTIAPSTSIPSSAPIIFAPSASPSIGKIMITFVGSHIESDLSINSFLL